MKSINLRTLFTKSRNDLPNWINDERVIYQIINLINNHSYIGQARWFYGRFVANTWMTHLNSLKCCGIEHYTKNLLYNAILKYKSRNFEVRILESNVENLDEREIYWIHQLHTCIYDPAYTGGYNLTSGGGNADQLMTKESRAKATKVKMERYGNPLGPNAIKHSLEVRSLIGNGDPAYMLHSKEVIKKRSNTNIIRYGDPCGQMHTPEVIERAAFSMRLTKLFNQIINRLTPEMTSLNEYLATYSSDQKRKLCINRLSSVIDYLIIDDRWTDQMTLIFKDLIQSD